MEKGKVIKKLANKFWIESSECVFVAEGRGNLKEEGIVVGDNVNFFKTQTGEFVVESIEKRKNILVRPPLANLTQMIMVVAKTPKPDFCVIDKMLLFCKVYGISPILCVNKKDILTKDLLNEIIDVYNKIVDKIVVVSCETGEGISLVKDLLQNNISAFAGQSAVGKSSLIKKLLPKSDVEIGGFAKKTERGKHTTRHCELFKIGENSYIADTPGFTFLDEKMLPISFEELPSYFSDFHEFAAECKYKSCSHTNEDINLCNVKRAVKNGVINKGRYERYLQIRKNLYERWTNSHE
ncbi:MAG: ribosome small subunit-dependent GTPase A [Clostridia bacterium]